MYAQVVSCFSIHHMHQEPAAQPSEQCQHICRHVFYEHMSTVLLRTEVLQAHVPSGVHLCHGLVPNVRWHYRYCQTTLSRTEALCQAALGMLMINTVRWNQL